MKKAKLWRGTRALTYNVNGEIPKHILLIHLLLSLTASSQTVLIFPFSLLALNISAVDVE